jgi:hypothetical protein
MIINMITVINMIFKFHCWYPYLSARSPKPPAPIAPAIAVEPMSPTVAIVKHKMIPGLDSLKIILEII